VTPDIAYVVTHMLRGVVERGTGQAAKSVGRPIAAKTGTTNDYSNAWFIGFTPHIATGVWVGYDRPRSLGRDETGGRTAVPIWTAYMAKVLGESAREDFPVPERVSLVPIDLDPSNECVRVVTMAFVRGTEPSVSCGPRRQAITPGALSPTPAPTPPSVVPPPAPPPMPAPSTGPAPAPAAPAPSQTSSPREADAWPSAAPPLIPLLRAPVPADVTPPPAPPVHPDPPAPRRRPEQQAP
jgi:membrane peptidoglycan carboxypeptidase